MRSLVPSTLLLTRWAPDARYAGGEDLRKRTPLLPIESMRWAYIDRPIPNAGSNLPEHKAFPPPALHWRMRGTALQLYWTHLIKARSIAREIARWVESFKPELLWIGSDFEGITVGRQVARILNIPIHVTVYDAFETCRFFNIPWSFRVFYMREVRQCLKRVQSFDAVSRELVEHLPAHFRMPALRRSMVFPPSSRSETREARDANETREARDEAGQPTPAFGEGDVRKIAFCGAVRSSDAEWRDFIALLARLPWKFEIVAFSDPEYFYHSGSGQSNVQIIFQPYASTEDELVRQFCSQGIHAAYLALWKHPDRGLFARTSLSSKLTAYAAAGLPVIVDAPENSVAWRLVRQYAAGVLIRWQMADGRGQRTAAFAKDWTKHTAAAAREDRGQRAEDGQDQQTLGELTRLFSDATEWQKMAEGSARMCREEFDLERNMERFRELLEATARGQRAEDRGQRTDSRRQNTDDSSKEQMTEGRGRKEE